MSNETTTTKPAPRRDLFMTPQGDGRFLLWLGTGEHAVARHVEPGIAAELCRLWNAAHAQAAPKAGPKLAGGDLC